MLVKKGTTLTSYDESRFVISTKSGRYFIVNRQVSNLFKILNNSLDWNQAHQKFQNRYSMESDFEAFYKMVFQALGGKEILCDDKSKRIKVPNSSVSVSK